MGIRESKTTGETLPFGFLATLLLVLSALIYYGFYWRSGLKLSGEEGVAAMVAQRLNAGARPIVDTFLGYNVGWFYPIAWLFKATGPNYLALRGYFFLLAILSGLSGCWIVMLVTRHRLLSIGTGLILIMLPGVIGRNYMGLLGLLGMLALLGTFVVPHKNKQTGLSWMVFTGFVISLTWFVRIDLGFFLTTLFLLTTLLFLVKPVAGFFARCRSVLLGIAILTLSFLVIQGPVYSDALHRGFGTQFAQQYLLWPLMIKNSGSQILNRLTSSQKKPVAATSTTEKSELKSHALGISTQGSETPASTISYSDTSLQRPSLNEILKAPTFKDRLFALIVYLPVPVASFFVFWGLLMVLFSLLTREVNLWRKGALLLVSTGASLVLFPQYFFWRPDMVHLGEFMVPFLVTLVLGIFLAGSEWGKSDRWKRLALSLVIFPAILDLSCYLVKGWQTDGSGSIAASRRRHLEFTASNGVRVKLNPEELLRDTLLRDTILNHSRPGDYVVCYPYFPMVNFMTDRPSYEHNLYADNAIPSELFFNQAKGNIEHFHPAVIVIGTGKVNSTESSRFQNWASKTYDYIREHFQLVASDGEVEIYAREAIGEGQQRP